MGITNLDAAIAAYGASAKAKLASPVASGQPEDQLRTPFSTLLGNVVELLKWRRADVVAVGESSLGDLKVRPDFAITFGRALVEHVELKAPAKGYVENVPAAIWRYEISGKQVLRQWFSYRKKNRAHGRPAPALTAGLHSA